MEGTSGHENDSPKVSSTTSSEHMVLSCSHSISPPGISGHGKRENTVKYSQHGLRGIDARPNNAKITSCASTYNDDNDIDDATPSYDECCVREEDELESCFSPKQPQHLVRWQPAVPSEVVVTSIGSDWIDTPGIHVVPGTSSLVTSSLFEDTDVVRRNSSVKIRRTCRNILADARTVTPAACISSNTSNISLQTGHELESIDVGVRSPAQQERICRNMLREDWTMSPEVHVSPAEQERICRNMSSEDWTMSPVVHDSLAQQERICRNMLSEDWTASPAVHDSPAKQTSICRNMLCEDWTMSPEVHVNPAQQERICRNMLSEDWTASPAVHDSPAEQERICRNMLCEDWTMSPEVNVSPAQQERICRNILSEDWTASPAVHDSPAKQTSICRNMLCEDWTMSPEVHVSPAKQTSICHNMLCEDWTMSPEVHVSPVEQARKCCNMLSEDWTASPAVHVSPAQQERICRNMLCEDWTPAVHVSPAQQARVCRNMLSVDRTAYPAVHVSRAQQERMCHNMMSEDWTESPAVQVNPVQQERICRNMLYADWTPAVHVSPAQQGRICRNMLSENWTAYPAGHASTPHNSPEFTREVEGINIRSPSSMHKAHIVLNMLSEDWTSTLNISQDHIEEQRQLQQVEVRRTSADSDNLKQHGTVEPRSYAAESYSFTAGDSIRKRTAFLSDDPLENRDNQNPEWDNIRRLSADKARYNAVRELWSNPALPDPHRNLTWYNHKRRGDVADPVSNGGQKRKASTNYDTMKHAKRRHVDTYIYDKEPKKLEKKISKECYTSCEVLEDKTEEIRNEMHDLGNTEFPRSRARYRSSTGVSGVGFWQGTQEATLYRTYEDSTAGIRNQYGAQILKHLCGLQEFKDFNTSCIGLVDDSDSSRLSRRQMKDQRKIDDFMEHIKFMYISDI
ncbi:uncharacterized protein LOC135387521 [Ornithodoros turicata]|uniref:uncharacterized protein LOC135387521 n=1 Tax=Ornithodoros turicata TaxID=34597 RepID=UPI0031391EF2